MSEITEHFAIDRKDGQGYTVYYKRVKGCYRYDVTFSANGGLLYSKTQQVKRKDYEEMKKQAN